MFVGTFVTYILQKKKKHSAFRNYLERKPVGQLPEFRILVSRILINRTTQPRYMFVWSVKLVVNYMKTKWENYENLSGKCLTYKLVTLMVLTSASRASAMHYLGFIVKSEDIYIFIFHKLHKRWRKTKPPPKLYLYKYSKNQQMCVVSDEYLKRTETWATNGDKFQLLLRAPV